MKMCQADCQRIAETIRMSNITNVHSDTWPIFLQFKFFFHSIKSTHLLGSNSKTKLFFQDKFYIIFQATNNDKMQ